MRSVTDKLVEIFSEVADRHHQAFEDQDGEDPDWADWYAEQIHLQLTNLGLDTLDEETVGSELQKLDQQYADEEPDIEWQRYYANYFLKEYG